MSYHETGGGFVNLREMGGGFVNVAESGSGFINISESGAGFVNVPESGRRRSILEFGKNANPCTIAGASMQIGCNLPPAFQQYCKEAWVDGTPPPKASVVAQIKNEIAAGNYTGALRQDYIDCFEGASPEEAPELYSDSAGAPGAPGDMGTQGPTDQNINQMIQSWFNDLNKSASEWYKLVEGSGPDDTVLEGDAFGFTQGSGAMRRVNPLVIVGGVALLIGGIAYLARRQ